MCGDRVGLRSTEHIERHSRAVGGRKIGGGIDGDQQLILAEADHVAIGEHVCPVFADRPLRVVHISAIRGQVLEEPLALPEMHAQVAARDIAQRIRQHPVVVGRTADRAAAHAEDDRGTLSERATLGADDTQSERHETTVGTDPRGGPYRHIMGSLN
jgi:hypothetical protein